MEREDPRQSELGRDRERRREVNAKPSPLAPPRHQEARVPLEVETKGASEIICGVLGHDEQLMNRDRFAGLKFGDKERLANKLAEQISTLTQSPQVQITLGGDKVQLQVSQREPMGGFHARRQDIAQTSAGPLPN